jgi:hypothetical protein
MAPSNNRVFSCPREILRILIWVTSPSLYWHEQGSGIINKSIEAISDFKNDQPRADLILK